VGSTHVDIAKRIMYLTQGVTNVVVGTLYKDMKLKPNILLEYTKERYIDSDIPKTVDDMEGDNVTDHRTSAEDVYILEDETGRIKLVLDTIKDEQKELVSSLVTGVIVAVLGEQDHNGYLIVKEFIFHDLPQQERLPSMSMTSCTRAYLTFRK